LLKDVAPPPNSGTIRKARSLQKQMSLPEVLLWRELRARPCGLKFRRQHGSGDYVLDFYCIDARLCIEVDGQVHNMGKHPEHDAGRDSWFNEVGIETLRLPAVEVLRDAVAAAEGVALYARERLPLHHPLRVRSPSPSKLEEDV
jgi:very-short-patch-repair endonuclease